MKINQLVIKLSSRFGPRMISLFPSCISISFQFVSFFFSFFLSFLFCFLNFFVFNFLFLIKFFFEKENKMQISI